MKARTALPSAILATILSATVFASAADKPVSGDTSAPNASLPDTEAQAKARAALNGEEPSAAPAETTPQPTAAPMAATSTEAPTNPAATNAVAATVAGSQPDTQAQARARAALHAEEASAPVVAPVAMSGASTTPSATTMQGQPMASDLTAGILPPAAPTSAAQQQQLDMLLEQYRMNQISAEEYHTRRAKILSGK